MGRQWRADGGVFQETLHGVGLVGPWGFTSYEVRVVAKSDSQGLIDTVDGAWSNPRPLSGESS